MKLRLAQIEADHPPAEALGPFEEKATEAYYNMTLPDPRWTNLRAEQLDFMRQWYYPSISNVSVHEVYPGHYLQFLYAKDFPTLTRKVFGSRKCWARAARCSTCLGAGARLSVA